LNVTLCPSFILHQRAYRETSLILDIFSLHHGRVSVVAKGVKGRRKNTAGLLQLYQPLLLSWAGHGELFSLRGVEAQDATYLLKGESTLCGLYINELIVRLLPVAEENEAIFFAYRQALASLEHGQNNEVTLRLFEKQLLSHLGYGLVLHHDVETGQAIEPDQHYYYLADSGLHRTKTLDGDKTITGRSLQHLIDERDFDQQSLNEIKQLMRGVIHFYLGGKPLQTRKLFMQMQQYSVIK
jgi:DNA repair protein RecO (recombination protein O)